MKRKANMQKIYNRLLLMDLKGKLFRWLFCEQNGQRSVLYQGKSFQDPRLTQLKLCHIYTKDLYQLKQVLPYV